MPAIKRRRGSAASLVRGLAGGLPLASGANLRTCSAIALLLPRRLSGWILNRVAHVFLDRLQLGEKTVGVGRVDAVKRGRRQFGAQPGELAEKRPRRLAQEEPVDAAVAIVAAAFDPA